MEQFLTENRYRCWWIDSEIDTAIFLIACDMNELCATTVSSTLWDIMSEPVTHLLQWLSYMTGQSIVHFLKIYVYLEHVDSFLKLLLKM